MNKEDEAWERTLRLLLTEPMPPTTVLREVMQRLTVPHRLNLYRLASLAMQVNMKPIEPDDSTRS